LEYWISIYPDGVDLAERAVLQPERDDMPDSFGRRLCPSPFMKAGPTRPTGQKQHVGVDQLMLAVAPGDFLDDHRLAAATIDAPYRVQPELERDEFVAPGAG